MQLFYDSISEVGKVRALNQDAVYGCSEDNWGIFVVCDGMGGHLEGERASAQIIESIEELIEEERDQLSGRTLDEIHGMLEEAVQEANQKIRRETPEGEICGSTMVLLFFLKDQYLVLWAGDSRCYGVSRRMFSHVYRQITMDDVVRESVAGNDPREIGKLTNAIGTMPEVRCNFLMDCWESGQVFLLCTDGIYKYIDRDVLEKIMVRSVKKHGTGALEQMEQEVLQNGAKDNYSAIIVNVMK